MADPSRKAKSKDVYARATAALALALPTLRIGEGVSSKTYATAVAYALVDFAGRLIFLAGADDERLAQYLRIIVEDLRGSTSEQLRTSANAQAILIARAQVCHDEEGSEIVDRAIEAMEDFTRELARLRPKDQTSPATRQFERITPKEK